MGPGRGAAERLPFARRVGIRVSVVAQDPLPVRARLQPVLLLTVAPRREPAPVA